MATKRRGNCYVASEALYHILGGKPAGWTPMQMRTEDDSHWFLKHESGLIIDPSALQFKKLPDYSKARGRGFLTKKPSKRTLVLMDMITWSGELNGS